MYMSKCQRKSAYNVAYHHVVGQVVTQFNNPSHACPKASANTHRAASVYAPYTFPDHLLPCNKVLSFRASNLILLYDNCQYNNLLSCLALHLVAVGGGAA